MTGLIEAGAGVRAGRRRLVVVLVASAVSMLGSAAAFVAIPWFILTTTGSATKTGVVSAVAGLGVVTSGLAFGPLLDRFGYRVMSVVGDVAAACAMGAVPLLYVSVQRVPLWAIGGLVFVSSASGMVASTARQSMLPELAAAVGVPLPRISAAYWTMQRAMLALAALPVGLLIGVLGPLNVLWADAASFVLASGMVLCGVRSVRSVGLDGSAGYLSRLLAGLTFIRTDRLVWLVVVVAVLVAALDAPLLTVILPGLARAGGPNMLGHLVFAYAGGTLAGVIGYGLVGTGLPRRALAVTCLLVIGVGYLPLAVSVPGVWRIVSLVVMGLATGPLTPLIVATVQQRTPSSLLGRVTGALLALVMAAIPVGRAAGGYAVDRWGLAALLVASALGYLGVGSYLLASRGFRTLVAEPIRVER